MEKLEKQGAIALPAKQQRKNKYTKKKIVFTAATEPPEKITIPELKYLRCETVQGKDEVKLWNEYMHRYHYLGYRVPFGAQQKYFIVSKDNEKLGCLLLASSSWALKARDSWLDWTVEDRSKKLNLIINNSRFLIFPWVQVKNLASKSLSLLSKRIRKDWLDRYGYEPVLLETFVDTRRYVGTCYKAANWIYLGETTGRTRMDRFATKNVSVKKIYVYPLVKDFRQYLRG